jgi:hypothetical protein
MKIKCLRGFVSSILTMEEGEVKEIELEAPTFEYWTSNGLVEEVKEDTAPEAVNSNENQ